MQGHATQKQERKKMDVITPEYRIGPIVTGQQLARIMQRFDGYGALGAALV
jgi:hypothetical protein